MPHEIESGEQILSKKKVEMAVHAGNKPTEFQQSQSQFSEFDDNMSSVIMNYENLAGFIQHNNPGARSRQSAGAHHGTSDNRREHASSGHHQAQGGGPRHPEQAQLGRRFTGVLNSHSNINFGLRANRSNLSSTLYDFMRDNDIDDGDG